MIDVHAGMAVFFSQLCGKMGGKSLQMCRCPKFCKSAHVQNAYRCYNQSLFAKQYESVCKSVNGQNFAHLYTCKICETCVQVLQLEFFCNYVSKSVDVRNIAHSHMCEMCAMPMQVLQLEFFITALLPTAKIQESPFAFAYLPTYKITKTALKEIVL